MLTKYKKDKNTKNKDDFDYSLLVDTTILLGEIMLKNGAETNRVENAMDKLLRTTKMKHIEAVVMTTSIIVTLSDPSIEHITAVSRIHDRNTNLNRVQLAHSLTEEYCNGKIDLETLFHELKTIKNINQYNFVLKNMALALVPPGFTIMLGGTVIDSLSALICGCILALLNIMFKFVKINNFTKKIFEMMCVSFVAVFLNTIISTDIQSVIIGFIMPYVPGIAITNAARDTFNADYMSGAARLLDALVQAFSVALGVYIGLFLGKIFFI